MDIFSTDLSDKGAIVLQRKETEHSTTINSVLHVVDDYDKKQYIQFFKKNRIKRRWVPIFDTYRNGIRTRIKTEYSIARIKAIRAIKQFSDKRKD